MTAHERSSHEPSERPVPDRFESFDLSIERIDETYRARVTASPRGPRRAVEIDSAGLSGSDHPARDESVESAREVRRQPAGIGDLQYRGRRLFESVFVGPIGEAFRASIERVRSAGVGLRICLRLDDAPELAILPWEALWDPEGQAFLADRADLPVVRTLGVCEQTPILTPAVAPLRVLALLPEPRGESKLGGATEWQRIREHLTPLVDRGELEVELLEPPTLEALGDRIDQAPCHVLHIVAHGGPGDRGSGGLLKLEDAAGRTDSVSGGELTRALERRAAPRLVVLSACHGARAAVDDAFDGMAQHLLSRGVPAVVAMRTAISDDAAVSFSTSLYRELASGRSVEGAMVNARRALALGQTRAEWATPVAYLRGNNVRILETTAQDLPAERGDTGSKLLRSLLGAAVLATVGLAGVLMWPSRDSNISTTAEWPAVEAQQPGRDSEVSTFAELPDICPPPPGLNDIAFVEVGPAVVNLGERVVIVEKPFCIATQEVSRRDWATVMGPDLHHKEWPADWPMTEVAPEDVQAFLKGLEAREYSAVFRLPTADEWELAARAGATTLYFFGDDPADLDQYGNCKNPLGADGHDELAPIGSFMRNRLGLYDVHGNVAEWVQWPEGVDPPLADDGREKALRLGGSMQHLPENCSFDRPAPVLAIKRPETGFRVVREIPGKKE